MNRATVLITSFQKRGYIFDALDSVIEQTFKDFDVLLVVSKLFSLDEFNRYRQFIKVVVDENAQSKCALLLTGIKLAQTDVIIFLDDDDLFSKDKIKIIMQSFEQNPLVEFIHNDHINIFGTNIEKYNKIKETRTNLPIHTRSIKEALRNDCDSNLSSIAIKKKLVLSYLQILKLIDSGDDTFFLYCALDAQKHVINLPEKLTYYRIHASGKTHSSGSFKEYVQKVHEKLESDVKTHQTYSQMFSDSQLVNIQKLRAAYYLTLQITYEHFFAPWIDRRFLKNMYAHFKWISFSGNHPPRPIKYILFFLMLISSEFFISTNYILSQYRLKGKY